MHNSHTPSHTIDNVYAARVLLLWPIQKTFSLFPWDAGSCVCQRPPPQCSIIQHSTDVIVLHTAICVPGRIFFTHEFASKAIITSNATVIKWVCKWAIPSYQMYSYILAVSRSSHHRTMCITYVHSICIYSVNTGCGRIECWQMTGMPSEEATEFDVNARVHVSLARCNVSVCVAGWVLCKCCAL